MGEISESAILIKESGTKAGASISKKGRITHENLFGNKTKIISDLVFFNPLPAITKFVREAGMEIE